MDTSLISFTLLLFTLLTLETETSSDLFSSTDAMKRLFVKEQTMMDSVQQQLELVQGQLDHINAILEKFDKEKTKSEDDVEKNKKDEEVYVSHPLNTLRLLRRSVTTWPSLEKLLRRASDTNKETELWQFMDSLPKTAELEGAANGIFLLQETYDLDMAKMAKGIVNVPGSNEELRAEYQLDLQDLENLAKLSFNRGFHDRAVEWASTALNVSLSSSSSSSSSSYLSSLLSTLRRRHDEVLSRKGPRSSDHRTYALPIDPKMGKKKKFRNISDRKQGLRATDYTRMEKMSDEQQWEVFNALCRGEKNLDNGMNKSQVELVKCAFYHGDDVFLKLAPFKMETLNVAPALSVVHDFISSQEASAMRNVAVNKLRRSGHQGKRESSVQSFKRTSSQTWLMETEENGTVDNDMDTFVVHPVADEVSKRISVLTRLSVHHSQGSEAYQVANYGLGGVYNHHTDSMGEHWPGSKSSHVSSSGRYEGERVMTLMMYLADVKAGGATVFSAARKTVWPHLGKLVMWYNHDAVGRADFGTMHGGCPVLAGSKWIANKWIRFYPQYKTLPCANQWTVHALQRFKPLLL